MRIVKERQSLTKGGKKIWARTSLMATGTGRGR
ncbi:MAG: hypothetical protein FD156_426 [Nitrospirae bacterium]|nr:MAG: hypothetical protein FD156_426 [Nitrospirota bacterium]